MAWQILLARHMQLAQRVLMARQVLLARRAADPADEPAAALTSEYGGGT
jgi:hypothetical protein